MKQPRIALFALTGFGNTVLPALCAEGFKPERLVTRAETGPFPYYDERPLTELAHELGVPCSFGTEGEERVAADPPDIVLCATYHRMLGASLLGKVRWAINLHPSLLPRYRGANPSYWVIRNGETETGVTAHLMSAAADAGDIVWQQKLALSEMETQGSLRRRLAELAARAAVDTLRAIRAATVSRTPQDDGQSSTFGRPSDADRTLNPSWTMAEGARAIRALSPFPGARADGNRIVAQVVGPVETRMSESLEPGLRSLSFRDGKLMVRLRPE